MSIVEEWHLMNNCQVGIVVPTMGTRPEYLRQCLQSIRCAGQSLIHIVLPAGVSLPDEITTDLYDAIIEDPMKGLPAAIHVGLESFPESVLYVNWLGDDDLLAPESLENTSELLHNNPRVPFVFGGCQYINESGAEIFTNRSGKFAVPLMRVGPQLVPQPGALFRRDVYRKIGGLDTRYKWAFDLDLFIRLSQQGKPVHLKKTLSSFRWHADSLSVGGREGSIREASTIRKRYLPGPLRVISEIWEWPMRRTILRAGSKVSKRYVPAIN